MRTLVAAGLIALALAAAGAGAGTEAAEQTVVRGITVSGAGSVSTVPDRAEMSFGVTSQGKTASAALKANGADMASVIAALKGAGVAAADIQTQYVSLSTRTSPDGETIVGYTAQNSVSARIRSLGRVGAVIDAAVEAGANQVNGPNLTRGDATALYRTALRAALANAKSKAKTIAAASGVRLGRVISVVEGSGAPPPIAYTDAKASTQTPIEPGTQLIQASVTVTFAVT